MLHSTPLAAALPYERIELPLASTSAPLHCRSSDVDLPRLHTASPAPISTLPAELLIEIFAVSSVIDPLSPLVLRAVSRRWRQTVDHSPQIWRHISLDDESRSIHLQNSQAAQWAHLSSPLQFDVEVNAANMDNVLPLISPLLPFIDRWRSFTLTGQREEEVNMSEMDLNPSTFQHLNVSICDWDTEYLEEDEVKNTFVSSYPPFAHMMNVWVSKLPSYEVMAPLRFTTVHITEGIFGAISAHPRTVLDFLRACPDLQCFYFHGWPHDEDLSTEDLPIVELPHLHTLQLKSTCNVRAYLSSLHTPLLQNLHLAHLNVDFKLQGVYNEPGDSEDEAGDPSQSPSSDQATGMGLRKLIHRSHPPLKVLEMDFSDMRTKDFRYIFDRLTDLEEFRIVASDMSDKVIRLLKPNVSEDGAIQLRLPHLRIFRLYNCQSLSGNAIVSALTARLAQTDNEADGNTLSEVAIVNCDRFSSRHESQLQRVLGSRLRYD
ncbi:hypothetical protein NP233_g12341 [Leucocoprinus birnbaumii]|uniref:F-box domain-containing protein n=1 Tax=Leucocoprinus birnbaumii TaxID=56174 RepID=A0AAD5YKI1_9AGAR|nr:hypothetical protein NP233_g12341 [Leucocoprinus birnbaumii]